MGFTISEGYGGGVSFEDFISMAADEILFDSLITNVIRGGGISVLNSSPLLKDLYITNNISRNVAGGIGLVNSNSIISNSIYQLSIFHPYLIAHLHCCISEKVPADIG